MKTSPFLLHALSPLHAGTGHAAEIIDLPIARMKATGIPFVPGSSIKGVLRDARRGEETESRERAEAAFGPSDDPEAHAGALVVGDARLLALPVRSLRGTFAWVTSPLLLALARRDLGTDFPVLALQERSALVTSENVCRHDDKLYLEDLDLPASESTHLDRWAAALAGHVAPGEDVFTRRFAAVDDDTMTFLWETATQVDARVRLDPTTRTVARGALWLEESLPPETLLLGLLAADRSRRNGVDMTPEDVLGFALPGEETVQLGGKASIGRGRCRVLPFANEGVAHEER